MLPVHFLCRHRQPIFPPSLVRAALRLAAQLVADGVQTGDGVANVMRNLPEWPAGFAATITGAVVTH